MNFFDELQNYDAAVADACRLELERQQHNIELIASENIVSKAVLLAAGGVLTNKYAEGYPSKRYYGGCQCVDIVEEIARDRAKKLFGADHANVQPHSGANANLAVFFALLNPGDTIMGMNLQQGGHLSHGSPTPEFPALLPQSEASVVTYRPHRASLRQTKESRRCAHK